MKGQVIPAPISVTQGQTDVSNVSYSCMQTRPSNGTTHSKMKLSPDQGRVDDDARLSNCVFSLCVSPLLAGRPHTGRGAGDSTYCKWYQLSLRCIGMHSWRHTDICQTPFLPPPAADQYLCSPSWETPLLITLYLPDFKLLDFIASLVPTS